MVIIIDKKENYLYKLPWHWGIAFWTYSIFLDVAVVSYGTYIAEPAMITRNRYYI